LSKKLCIILQQRIKLCIMKKKLNSELKIKKGGNNQKRMELLINVLVIVSGIIKIVSAILQ